ncbi:MAG: hypothetical protein ONB48_18540 [candidate division KSB1 bacterium]|nr:hypothetical protein [candidate division KSB1 bacterium]MDZ7275894.1 hypothetical protein [candidate division KSB1 bacterium]MDZ7287644.1 hypothetical protein [candidate division KSB1 bacterium]MDZ7306806.1 hypothetical protein [candidate division KSB1 bacterium]MDZ7350622.1 hypothetical protein [candidate division KSB1 bacterium]
MIPFLGSIGLGLVWGWLLAWLTARRPATHPFLKFLALAAATILTTFVPLVFVNLRAVIAFVLAMVLAFLIHTVWRADLSRRASSSSSRS